LWACLLHVRIFVAFWHCLTLFGFPPSAVYLGETLLLTTFLWSKIRLKYHTKWVQAFNGSMSRYHRDICNELHYFNHGSDSWITSTSKIFILCEISCSSKNCLLHSFISRLIRKTTLNSNTLKGIQSWNLRIQMLDILLPIGRLIGTVYNWIAGAYDDEEAAARAYDLAALKYWGPETQVNFKVLNLIFLYPSHGNSCPLL
jgi:hypothetical protein